MRILNAMRAILARGQFIETSRHRRSFVPKAMEIALSGHVPEVLGKKYFDWGISAYSRPEIE